MTSQDIAQRVADARFTPVRLREGYDMSEVDALLDRIVAVASDRQAVGALVAGARFTPVRLREGYDMSEVDAFLASLVGSAVNDERAVGSRARSAPTAAARTGGIHENRSWWSRLFGPKSPK